MALHLIDDDFYFDITDAIVSKDLKRVFEISSEVSKRGYDYLETLQGLLEHFRNLLAVKVANSTEFLETSQYFADKYIEYSKNFETQDLIRLIQIISNSEQQLKFSPQQKIRFEIVLSLLASIPNSIDLQELIKEIENLKYKSNLSGTNKSQQSLQPTSSLSNIAKENIPNNKTIQDEKGIEKINENISTKSSKNISKEEIEAQWNEFIDKYATKENTLTSLTNATFSFSDNLVALIAESQIVFENYNSQLRKSKIEGFLKEFFGDQIRFDVIPNFSSIANNKKNKTKQLETSEDSNNEDSNSKGTILDNNITELESAIIEIFNAKENN